MLYAFDENVLHFVGTVALPNATKMFATTRLRECSLVALSHLPLMSLHRLVGIQLTPLLRPS